MNTKDGNSGDGTEDGSPLLVSPPRKASPLVRLRNYFLAGIVVVAPIGITVYLAVTFVEFVDERVIPLIPARYNPETYLPFSIPGLGILVSAIVLIMIGFLAANFLGRQLVSLGERFVDRMPVIRSVYGALKQIIETVLSQSSTSFRQVVLIEYPRKNVWAIAFVTSDAKGEVLRKVRNDLVAVFVPTTPNPTSGFILFLPREDLILLDMTIEEGMKLVISAGLVAPPDRGAPDYVPPSNGNRKGNGKQNGKGQEPAKAKDS